MSGRTWIVIVNYRTADLTVDCLRSLSSQLDDLGGGRVLVVDNASGDGSVEALRAAIEANGWSAWAGVIPLDRNGGFAFGNNAGIRAAVAAADQADYVILLNPDTVVGTGAVKALVDFMEGHPRVAITGSRLVNTDGGIERSAHRKPSPLGEFVAGARLGLISKLLDCYVVSPPMRNEAHECDWVSGACLIVRNDAIEEVGPMDEGFFLYYEEVDFCSRVRAAGWSVWYVPEAKVEHLEGAATGIRDGEKRRPGYWYDSRRRFFVKHYGVFGLVLTDLLWLAGRLIYGFRCLLSCERGRPRRDPRWYTWDLLWGDLGALLNGSAWQIGRLGRQR